MNSIIKRFRDNIIKNSVQGLEWNKDYYEANKCPFCGCPDYSRIASKGQKLNRMIFRCIECRNGWVVERHSDGEIVGCMSLDVYLSTLSD